MRLPNFIVAGASKCGTTSIYHYLRQHPEVFLPEMKEIHFFSYDEIEKNINGPGDKIVLKTICSNEIDYSLNYRNVADQKAVGDISPSYFFYANAAGNNIKKKLGDVRIIIVLRNPVDKIYSQYLHLIRDARETEKFEDALKLESVRKERHWSDMWLYRESGYYFEKVRFFLELFGKQRVKIITYESFFEDISIGLAELCRFLEIDDRFVFKTDEIYNTSGAPKSKFIAKYILNGEVYAFAKKFIPSPFGGPIRRYIQRKNTGSKMHLEIQLKEDLKSVYKEDLIKLQNLGIEIHNKWK